MNEKVKILMPDVTPKWQRSSYCADSACVEVAVIGNCVAMRDSKRTDGAPIVFTADDWAGFLAWLETDPDRGGLPAA